VTAITAWSRVIIGFLVAPIAPSLLIVIPAAILGFGKVSESVWLVGLSGLLGYPIAIVLGVPLHMLFQRRGWSGPATYCVAGAILGLLIYLAYIALSGFPSNDPPRFLQPDPLGYDVGPNFYSYVFNDPLNATDPTGLDPGQAQWSLTEGGSPRAFVGPVGAIGAVEAAATGAATTAIVGVLAFGAAMVALPGDAAAPTCSGFGNCNQYVVRGGLSAAGSLDVKELSRLGLPERYGLSASSAPPPATVEQIATVAAYPNPMISYTTSYALQAQGYTIVATPTTNPLHVSILLPQGQTQLSRAQAQAFSALFTRQLNPNPRPR
jgi:hypothetical protein